MAKKGVVSRAKLSAAKTAAALSPRSGAQRAHSGHHRARHILPRGFDFATTPSFRRLRPPGALQAAAPSAEPCRACRPRSSPLPRSWRFQAAGTDARMEKDDCKITRGRPCAARAPGGGFAAAARPAPDRSGFLEHRENAPRTQRVMGVSPVLT